MLMERLDDCLKVHADMLDSTNIGSIYELQDLAALHYYLKVEHEFTPAEVEALLSFQDPLEVARWCKEENTHAHSFPICELLNEIRAYERFEPALKQDESSQTFARFREALASDYFGFREQALSWSRERLFDARWRLPHCPILRRLTFQVHASQGRNGFLSAIHPHCKSSAGMDHLRTSGRL